VRAGEAMSDGNILMPRTAEQIINAEIHLCVSHIVSTLAGGVGRTDDDATELACLCYQALELAAPLTDYETAAREAGWRDSDMKRQGLFESGVFDWPHACELSSVDPYDRDVFEHWAISDWLADKLEAKGEKVDRDFANLTVWARTTTGQAISQDFVIQQIAADLARAYGEG
jgi:hypothetical protein